MTPRSSDRSTSPRPAFSSTLAIIRRVMPVTLRPAPSARLPPRVHPPTKSWSVAMPVS
jgi:hypothetical protein